MGRYIDRQGGESKASATPYTAPSSTSERISDVQGRNIRRTLGKENYSPYANVRGRYRRYKEDEEEFLNSEEGKKLQEEIQKQIDEEYQKEAERLAAVQARAQRQVDAYATATERERQQLSSTSTIEADLVELGYTEEEAKQYAGIDPDALEVYRESEEEFLKQYGTAQSTQMVADDAPKTFGDKIKDAGKWLKDFFWTEQEADLPMIFETEAQREAMPKGKIRGKMSKFVVEFVPEVGATIIEGVAAGIYLVGAEAFLQGRLNEKKEQLGRELTQEEKDEVYLTLPFNPERIGLNKNALGNDEKRVYNLSERSAKQYQQLYDERGDKPISNTMIVLWTQVGKPVLDLWIAADIVRATTQPLVWKAVTKEGSEISMKEVTKGGKKIFVPRNPKEAVRYAVLQQEKELGRKLTQEEQAKIYERFGSVVMTETEMIRLQTAYQTMGLTQKDIAALGKMTEEEASILFAQRIRERATDILQKGDTSALPAGAEAGAMAPMQTPAELLANLNRLEAEGALNAAQREELIRLNNSVMTVVGMQAKEGIVGIPRLMQVANEFALAAGKPLRTFAEYDSALKRLMRGRARRAGEGQIQMGLSIDDVSKGYTKGGKAKAKITDEESAARAGQFTEAASKVDGGGIRYGYDPRNNTVTIHWKDRMKYEALSVEQQRALATAAKSAEVNFGIMWEPEVGVTPGVDEIDVISGGFTRADLEVNKKIAETEARFREQRMATKKEDDAFVAKGLPEDDPVIQQLADSNIQQSALINTLKNITQISTERSVQNLISRQMLNTPYTAGLTAKPIRKSALDEASPIQKAIADSQQGLTARMADIARTLTGPKEFASKYSFLMSAAERAKVPYRGTGIFVQERSLKERLDALLFDSPTAVPYEDIQQVIRTELPLAMIEMTSIQRAPVLLNEAADIPFSQLKNLAKVSTDGEKVRDLVYQRSISTKLITQGQFNSPQKVLSTLRAKTKKPDLPIFLLTPEGRAVLLTPGNGTAQVIAAAKMGGVNTVPGYLIDISGSLNDFRKMLKDNKMSLEDFARYVRNLDPKATKARPSKRPIGKEMREQQGLLTGELTRVGTSIQDSTVIPTKLLRKPFKDSDPILYNGETVREQWVIPDLVKVGEGSSRAVFEVGTDALLKVSKSELGKVQNLMSYNGHAWENKLIPRQFAGGDDWILVERHKPLEGKALDHFNKFLDSALAYKNIQNTLKDWAMGGNFIIPTDAHNYSLSALEGKEKIRGQVMYEELAEFLLQWRQSDDALLAFTEDGQQIFNWDEFAHYTPNLDIFKEDSWGVRADGTMVLIDEGSLYRDAIKVVRNGGKDTWIKFATRFDDDFKRNKAAKDWFSDYDGHNNFGFTPIPAIDGDEEDGTYNDDIWRSILMTAFASLSRGKGGKGKFPKKSKPTKIEVQKKNVLPKNTPKPQNLSSAAAKITLNSDIFLAKTGEPFGGVFPQTAGTNGATKVGIPSLDRDTILQPLGEAGYTFIDADVAATYNKNRAVDYYTSSMDNPLVINTDDELRKLTKKAGLQNLDIDTSFYAKTQANIEQLRNYIRNTLGHDGVVIAMDPAQGRIDLLDRYFQYDQVINMSQVTFKKAKGPNTPTVTVTKKTRSKKLQRQIMRAIDPPKSMKTISEEKLLRDRLRTLNIAIKEGKKLGAIEARKSVSARLRSIHDIKMTQAQRNTYLRRLQERIMLREKEMIRKELIQYIDKMLPTKLGKEFLVEKGKLIKTVNNTETRREFTKAIARIDNIRERALRKVLVNDLNKAVDRVTKSKQVSADYRKMVRDVMKDIDVVKRRKDTIARITRMRNHIDRNQAAGMDVVITNEMQKELEILAMKGIEHMRPGEIASLIMRINTLAELGKAKRRSYLDLMRLRRDKLLKQIESSEFRKLDSGEIARTPANIEQGLAPTRKEAMMNWVKTNLTRNYETTTGSIMPMDWFFDWLDGGLGDFDGTMMQVFRHNSQLDYNRFLIEKQKFTDDLNALVEKNKIAKGNAERITIYMQARRTEGRERLISMGVSGDVIDAVKMTPREMEMVKFFDDFLEKERPWLAKIARDIFNKEFTVLEDMFPMIADFKAAAEENLPIQDMFGDSLPRINEAPRTGGKRTKVKEGTIKSRTPGAKMPIQVNAIQTMAQHAENTFYMKYMAEHIKTLGDVVNATETVVEGGKVVDKALVDANVKKVPILQGKVGDVAYSIIKNYVDLLARKGGAEGQGQIAYLSAMNRNISPAVLAFKWASIFIQPTAINNTAAAIKSIRPYWGMVEIATSRADREFIIRNFPEIRERIGDDIGFVDKMDWATIEKWNRAGWMPLQKLDQWTAAGGALGVYKHELAKKGIKFSYDKVDMDAVTRAQTLVRATQSSSAWRDAPAATGSGTGLFGNRELNRGILKFQSFGLADFRTVKTYVFAKAARGRDAKERFSSLFALMAILMGIFSTVAVRRGVWHMENFLTGRDAEEDRRLEDSWLKQMLLESSQKIPFVSQVISMGIYDSEPAPALSALNKFVYGGFRIDTAKGVVDFLQGLGSLAGIGGTAQVASLLKASLDGWFEGGSGGSGNPDAEPPEPPEPPEPRDAPEPPEPRF